MKVDAVIIGAGFYGCHVALALRDVGFGEVLIVEREDGLMRRASYVNQARVHNGYHYPRSRQTALSSRNNFARFVEEHRFAVEVGVEMIYAIARQSRVSADQFERFCQEIGAACVEAGRDVASIFDKGTIEAAFCVEEYAFDAVALADDLRRRLNDAGIEVALGVSASIRGAGESHVDLETSAGPIRAGYVFNCTYGDLDSVGSPLNLVIKKEIAEIALVRPPDVLAGRAVTVMDGPFFSTMPFPALDCYSLTHVRYTPHQSWIGPNAPDLPKVTSRGDMMLRDAARYIPRMGDVQLIGSLYEIKAILMNNEDNDGRPIVFEESKDSSRIISILGSKIDNIYDVVELIHSHRWN